MSPAPSVSAVPLSDAGVLADWRRLQSVAPAASPFLTWQWAEALAAVPEVSRRIRVLRVAQGGAVLGLFPLETWRGPRRLRVLGPAGGTWLGPDHLDVVARAGERDVVAKAVVRLLARVRTFDLLDLEGLSRGGALALALEEAFPARALRLPGRDVPAPFVELSSPRAADLFPSRNLRQQVGRGLRAAERTGGGFQVASAPEEVAGLVEELARLHNQRFGSESQLFATRSRMRFHAEAARRLAAHGMARVYRLEVEGRSAALLYALVLGRRQYYYNLGIRPELGLSPGLTVLGQALLAAAHEGAEEFDLLRGDHSFKRRFATGTRQDLHVRLLRATPLGLVDLAARLPAYVKRRAQGVRA